ncbi:hypothetical protein P792_03220 [Asaia sp. SF2.1]|nr:hypothetical protein P792_03220 [Asaia sp. SF2.1]
MAAPVTWGIMFGHELSRFITLLLMPGQHRF